MKLGVKEVFVAGGLALATMIPNTAEAAQSPADLKACQEKNLQGGIKPTGVDWASEFLRQKLKTLGVKDLQLRVNSSKNTYNVSALITMRNGTMVRLDNFDSSSEPTQELQNNLKNNPEYWEQNILNLIKQNSDQLAPYICQQEKLPLRITR